MGNLVNLTNWQHWFQRASSPLTSSVTLALSLCRCIWSYTCGLPVMNDSLLIVTTHSWQTQWVVKSCADHITDAEVTASPVDIRLMSRTEAEQQELRWHSPETLRITCNVYVGQVFCEVTLTLTFEHQVQSLSLSGNLCQVWWNFSYSDWLRCCIHKAWILFYEVTLTVTFKPLATRI